MGGVSTDVNTVVVVKRGCGVAGRGARWARGRWARWALAAMGAVATVRAGFELSGELPAKFAEGTVIVLRESLEERTSTPVATGQVVAGKFRLVVDAEPGLFGVRVGEAEAAFVAGEGQALRMVATEGGEVKVTGAEDQAKFEAYEAARKAALARLVLPVREAANASEAAGDAVATARWADQEVAGTRQYRHELNDFTLEKLRGSPALYAASLRWDGDYRLEELATAVREFAARHPRWEIARLMEERVTRFRALAIGAVAPVLAGKGPDGKAVALADLRGRLVLVDFWASWCTPCRAENRRYVELYRRYRAAGWEILAVSMDEGAPAWKAAIAKDGAVWRHVSDLLAWKSPLAARYGVTALPASFLIDAEGRIVGKDLRGKELEAVLAERFGKGAAPSGR